MSNGGVGRVRTEPLVALDSAPVLRRLYEAARGARRDGATVTMRERYQRSALLEFFRCRDHRWFMFTIVNHAREWPLLATCVGKPEWINDPRFATPEARTENAEELTRALEEIFLKRDWPEWRQIFTEAGITFGPIAEVADHISCPQVAANGLLPAFADGGGIRTVDSPIRLAGEIKTQPRIAPDIGQHSHAILRELGLSQSEVAKMFESGAAR